MVIHRGNNDIGLRQILHRGYELGNVFGVDLETFRLFDGDSSLSNLPQNLTIDGNVVAPNFVYEGKNATTSTWTATVGSNLAIAASGDDPTVDLSTPLTDDDDECVYFPAGKVYETSTTDFGDIPDGNDFYFSILLKTGTGRPACKRLANTRWHFYQSSATDMSFGISDGSTVANVSATVGANTWNLIEVACDRDNGSGLRLYVNGVNADTGNPASVAGTLVNAAAMLIGSGGAYGGKFTGNIAYFAQWIGADIFDFSDTTSIDALAKERFARMAGIFPQIAKGTAVPTTVTRATSAYLDIYRDSAVELHQVGAGWPRLCRREDRDGNIVTGYLAEEARTNLVTYSEDIAGHWAKSTASAVANETGPDGVENSATTITALASASAFHTVYNLSTIIDAEHEASVYVKAGTHNYFGLFFDYNGLQRVWFNLSSGTVGGVSSGSPSRYSITSIGGGWYRVTIGGVAVAGARAISLALVSDTGSEVWAAAGNETVIVWGPQLEQGAFPTSYIKASGGAATRNKDELRYAAGDNVGGAAPSGYTLYAEGLFSTNIPLGSYFFVEANDGTSFNILGIQHGPSAWRGYFGVYSNAGDGNNAVFYAAQPPNFNDGVAHQIKGTVSLNDARIFMDEVESTTDTEVNPPAGLISIYVGTNRYSTFQTNGLVSNIRIFKRPLPNNTIPKNWE